MAIQNMKYLMTFKSKLSFKEIIRSIYDSHTQYTQGTPKVADKNLHGGGNKVFIEAYSHLILVTALDATAKNYSICWT